VDKHYTVSARKYRPTRFQDVLGQEHVTTTLVQALRKGKLAHAFLFSGPRGVGKTTCARILAKVVNCLQPSPEMEPCEQCDSCTAFNQQASFNVFEMDGASNNKVEHIHQLLDNVRTPPFSGKYKVFIIDEVHMLSKSAFNAFLKTLEEPPPYAIFILATTEKNKIIPTILSRCQIYDFHKIPVSLIVRQLQKICSDEHIHAETEALQLIASKSDGSMRDALSIFDRIASATDGNIRYSDVLNILHVLDYEHFFQFTDAFLSEDIGTVMKLFEELNSSGFDEHQILIGLASHIRQLFALQFPSTEDLLQVPDAFKQRYVEQAKLCSPGFLLSALDTLNQCEAQFPLVENTRLHVETALLKLTFLHRRVQTLLTPPNEKKTPNPPLKNRSSSAIPNSDPPSPATTTIPAPTSPDNPTTSADHQPAMTPTPSTKPKVVREPSPQTTAETAVDDIPTIQDIESLQQDLQHRLHQTEHMPRKSLTQEEVRTLWDAYLQNITSPSDLRSYKNAKLKVEDTTIHLYVQSQLDKSVIQRDTDFIQRIRSYFHNPDIQLQIHIRRPPSTPKNTPRPFLTDKEKYDLMAEKNPALRRLVRTFDLKISSD